MNPKGAEFLYMLEGKLYWDADTKKSQKYDKITWLINNNLKYDIMNIKQLVATILIGCSLVLLLKYQQ